MDSALPRNSSLPLSYSKARNSLRTTVAFLMLGGASWVLLAVFLLLQIPQVLMQNDVRSLLQEVSSGTLVFVLLFSYPHFVFSYRFAYQQGRAFITRHSLELVAYPF